MVVEEDIFLVCILRRTGFWKKRETTSTMEEERTILYDELEKRRRGEKIRI